MNHYTRHVSCHLIPRLAIGLLLLAWLTGCAVPHTQYRGIYDPCTEPDPASHCPEHALQIVEAGDASYTLGFIEFDDQGQVWDRQQMDRVITHIGTQALRDDVIIAVFAHGWKHNASGDPEDTDITMVRNALQRLSRIESRMSRDADGNPVRQPRQILGVYLGWRGASERLPGVRELSFWNRRVAAQRVGNRGAVEVLSRLAQIRDIRRQESAALPAPAAPEDMPSRPGARQEPQTRLVVVGHSFGAALVYAAVDQLLVQRFVYSLDEPGVVGEVDGFGDLVVLVNPAFEALRFTVLSDMAGERASYPPQQLPVLAILNSEADKATGYAFPVGQWSATFNQNHREMRRRNPVTGEETVINQKRANRRSVGHFTPYQTHTLRPDRAAPEQTADQLGLLARISQRWENDAPGMEIRFPGTILRRNDDSVGRNPYLVISVDGELIPGHNAIDGDEVLDFLVHLIQLSTQSEDPAEREAVRERMRQLEFEF